MIRSLVWWSLHNPLIVCVIATIVAEQWTFTASSKTTTLTFISGDKHARTITHGPVVAAIAVTEGGSR